MALLPPNHGRRSDGRISEYSPLGRVGGVSCYPVCRDDEAAVSKSIPQFDVEDCPHCKQPIVTGPDRDLVLLSWYRVPGLPESDGMLYLACLVDAPYDELPEEVGGVYDRSLLEGILFGVAAVKPEIFESVARRVLKVG